MEDATSSPSPIPLNNNNNNNIKTHYQQEKPTSSPITIPTTKSKKGSTGGGGSGGLLNTLMEATSLRSPSFKEDSYNLTHLKPTEKKSLTDLKTKLSTSTSISNPTLWSIPLLSNTDSANVILLKFLRARDFNPSESLTMLEKTLSWRTEFKTDTILDEEMESYFKELEGVVAYMHGFDRDGHPVCYNAYGMFKDKEMYEKVFGDDEKLNKFLRWRVQVLERGVKMLHFKSDGINEMIQVTDLKDMPKRELRSVSNRILSLFQDNYPEMVARKIFINVPWYFSLLYSMFSPFLTQRTKNKFVIAKEGNVTETLYKFIRPEDIPVQYGGLSRPGDLKTGPAKPASEFKVRGGEKVNIQIEGIENGATITWDIVVGGWDLEYSCEFIPNAADSYTISVEKPRKVKVDEEAIHNSFTARESGKLVLSVDNTASRVKKVAAYRYIVRKLSTSSVS